MTSKSDKKKPLQHALAYDLGGTKVAAAIIDSTGKILEETRQPAHIKKGPSALADQMAEMGKGLLKKHPKPQAAGIASAGPLDPKKGVLLDPTNMFTDGQSWGVVPLADELQKRLNLPVFLDNDAAAAILAESWQGIAKGCDNAMILTLGTGLGTGVIANGQLVRSGRNLHTEAGHVSLNCTDQSAPCGCGLFGCAEAYLSGSNFAQRVNAKWNTQHTAKDIANLARENDSKAIEEFHQYASWMAQAMQAYVVLYAPEIIVITGSFAFAADLFLQQTGGHLEKLLVRRRVGIDLMPRLEVSQLNNQAGLLGGAYIAFFNHKDH